MASMARVVVPGYPHHVTQRGNRRQKAFFCDDDYRYYIQLISEFTREAGAEAWAYCLMPNHVHLVAQDDGLVRVKPMLERVSDWGACLSSGNEEETEAIQLHTRTGRPLGGDGFVQHLESVTGKVLAPGRPGPKAKV